MKPDARIVRLEHAQPLLRRTLWRGVAMGFWLFYIYLWLPGSTLLAWSLGLRMMYGELYERSEQLDPFVVAALPPIAVLSACLLIAWAEHNRLRFGGRERRLRTPDVPREDIARRLGTTPDIAERMARQKIAVLDLAAAAHPVAVLAAPRPAPAAEPADC